jgi:hypothetical protein
MRHGRLLSAGHLLATVGEPGLPGYPSETSESRGAHFGSVVVVERGFGRGRALKMARAVLPSSHCGPAR